ncbi:MAG: NUDIX domain-containing protein [Bacteroidota bacterium]
MYKIYINERPLILCNTNDLESSLPKQDELLVARYPGKKKFLVNYIDQMEKSDRYDAIVLHAANYEQLVKDYQSLYKIIEAAGGLVFNEKGEVLFIHRLGWWDLPKGKLEKGESIGEGAVREVEEETGLKDIQLGEKIYESYHTYRNRKDKRVLKRTYWFKMTAPNQPLTPQTEEDITEAVWRSLSDFFDGQPKVYRSILDVLETVG